MTRSTSLGWSLPENLVPPLPLTFSWDNCFQNGDPHEIYMCLKRVAGTCLVQHLGASTDVDQTPTGWKTQDDTMSCIWWTYWKIAQLNKRFGHRLAGTLLLHFLNGSGRTVSLDPVDDLLVLPGFRDNQESLRDTIGCLALTDLEIGAEPPVTISKERACIASRNPPRDVWPACAQYGSSDLALHYALNSFSFVASGSGWHRSFSRTDGEAVAGSVSYSVRDGYHWTLERAKCRPDPMDLDGDCPPLEENHHAHLWWLRNRANAAQDFSVMADWQAWVWFPGDQAFCSSLQGVEERVWLRD